MTAPSPITEPSTWAKLSIRARRPITDPPEITASAATLASGKDKNYLFISKTKSLDALSRAAGVPISNQ